MLGKDIHLAESFFSRLKGLMFKGRIRGDGLLIRPCNSIHTFFMKFNLDVVFLSRDFKVVKIIRRMPPWRMSKVYFNAFQVLELKAGTLTDKLVEGDYLEEVCLN